MRGRSSTSKRLVIDTSVARASGGEGAEHPTSKNCRDFLKKVKEVCHQMVISPEISDEWNRHRSGFARTWQRQMISKKKVAWVKDTSRPSLTKRIESCFSKDRDAEAVRKDVFLIEAALATDSTVASLEKVVRGLFATASNEIGELRDIVWVNPSREEECLQWLEDGAEPDEDRMLKNFSE